MATSFNTLDTCGPTKRTFKPGQFATKRFNSISGSGTTRLYGSKAFTAEMSLTFILNDKDTCSFLKCWDDAKGDYDTINLPNEFLSGASTALACGIPTYLNWRWANAPSVESLFPNRSRVQITLIATLDS